MNRKEWKKKNKWKRGLSKKLVEYIDSLNPSVVEFKIVRPNYVQCIIETTNGVGIGVSLCSSIDEPVFNEKRGKNIAAGRAVKALKNRYSSEVIRNWQDASFPRTWLIRQANKISTFSLKFGFKSIFEFSNSYGGY